MDTALHKRWTQEEFFAWAETQDGRYEFNGFEPVAMTGGSLKHMRIIKLLYRALDARLDDDGPYEWLGSKAGVETVGMSIRYPDALITGTRGDGESHTTLGVIAIFEVTRPSAKADDFGLKRHEYARVPTILRYVLIDSEKADVTVFERGHGDEEWSDARPVEDGVILIPEAGIEIPVAEIYRGIRFPGQDVASH